MRNLFVVAFIVLAVICESFASPFLQELFNLNGYNQGYNLGYSNEYSRNVQPARRRPATPKPRGRSYKDICRAVNPAPYAFPNKIPYPSVPIC
ncbi:CLUMA_CG002548, isoform A [Clunio marinus]|uniref:CLUMA_CG002548, isoform A n=1 Tax=Clunio marinus TaxID=568069 RepID=A0A1J1HNM0_9DIPT|nr:CLUMA_CG002548, isoform A [Clunio marinus]